MYPPSIQKPAEIRLLEGAKKQAKLLNDPDIQHIFTQLKTEAKNHEQLQQEIWVTTLGNK